MKHIGLFLGTTEDEYGKEILRGVLDGLRGERNRLICYTSGTIQARHGYEAQRNVLYELVDARSVDALIVAGSLSHNVSNQELTEFCRRYAPIPVITMSVALPGIPTVLIDNREGFAAVVDHLIKVHGYTRLAFIGGPPRQQEAEERQAAFQERTAAAGISVPAEWVVNGDYTHFSGRLAAEGLLRSLEEHPERPGFQAIVCANDSMALGAMDFLGARGWKFPGDCAVTGFDDLQESRVNDPPLTTCFQSHYDLAAEAARLALRVCAGEAVPDITCLTPDPIIRVSCGCPAPHPAKLDRPALERALEEAEAAWQSESRERAVISGLLYRLRGATEFMLTSDSFSRLLEVLSACLDSIGFHGFWMSMFEDQALPGTNARLHLAAPPGGERLATDRGIVFPSPEIIPGGVRQLPPDVDLLVVEALYSRQFRMGFIVFATDRASIQITGTLRGQISGALQGVLLLEERKAGEQQLIQNEKMAALGSMVAGVSHEINSPIGIALTAITFLTSQAREFGARFKAGQVTKPELERLLEDIEMAGSSVETNLHRAADLVASFKQMSSDQTSEQRRQFAVKEYLQETLLSLHFQWRKRQVEVDLSGPDSLLMDSYPGILAQIITNLINNCLLHAFAKDQPGRIDISIEDKGNSVQLRFADDGVGIPYENQPKVFEPFFTTKRGQGGTGLGLHIIFTLVIKVLGGTIGFTSVPGAGTRFDLLLPKTSPQTGRE
jgi:DNA-binding LacI/PurR family transcriptional regulator/signal transduction histidine kinase